MSQIQPNNNQLYTGAVGTPLYNYSYVQPEQQQQQTVAVATPSQAQVYNYPQSSIYGQPTKQAASGVNIYIYNPSAIGGPTSNSTANATYTMPGASGSDSNGAVNAAAPIAQTPIQQPDINPQQNVTIANSPISKETTTTNNNDNDEKKTKNVVEITDDYVKTLESYLRSADKAVRKNGITELIKRFEEDESRYDDPALNALLNIALQDPDAQNRLMSLSVLASGNAHGDANTLPIVEASEKSDAIYGQEALMANQAKLQMAGNRITVDK